MIDNAWVGGVIRTLKFKRLEHSYFAARPYCAWRPALVAKYAYGPACGLPDSKVGTFTQALYDEAQDEDWTVISMKNEWKHTFAFEK